MDSISKHEIKLVIWDLDETFWKGVLSEGGVELVQENITIAKELVNRGIMNSICSKNDPGQVKAFLESIGLWDFFIFPKISWNRWNPKGKMVQDIINDTQLRGSNILFIDDNHLNLKEAQFYNPDIATAFPDFIPEILNHPSFKGKSDPNHSRLQQYKVLEKKAAGKEQYSSNEDFLESCNIKASIIKDCSDYADRIYELIHRTNQLNYTKKRIAKEEVREIIEDPGIETAIIEVVDDYGDYGVVGFYALKDGDLLHFVFSCRILNLGVEQWLYATLGYPSLSIEGKVATKLNKQDMPHWINSTKEHTVVKNRGVSLNKKIKCLIRGTCDLEQVTFYFTFNEFDVVTEFNYVSPKNIMLQVHREHSEIVRSGQALTDEQKKFLADKLPFYDDGIFETQLFSGDYQVVLYSVLMDYTQGLYRYKNDGDITAVFGTYTLPLTDANSWSYYPELEEPFLQWFAGNFEFLGPLSEERFEENLYWLRQNLPKDTVLILLNGSEVELDHDYEAGRYLHHKKMNAIVKNFVRNSNNTHLVDVTKFVTSPNDVIEHIRHYQRQHYETIANQAGDIISKKFGIRKPNTDMPVYDAIKYKTLTLMPSMVIKRLKSLKHKLRLAGKA